MGSGEVEKSQPGPGVGWWVVARKPRLLPLGLNLSQAWFPHHSPHVTGLIRCPDLGRAACPHAWGTRVWRGDGGSALCRKQSVSWKRPELGRLFVPTPQFKSISSSVLSLLHSPTLTSIHDYWKNQSDTTEQLTHLIDLQEDYHHILQPWPGGLVQRCKLQNRKVY